MAVLAAVLPRPGCSRSMSVHLVAERGKMFGDQRARDASADDEHVAGEGARRGAGAQVRDRRPGQAFRPEVFVGSRGEGEHGELRSGPAPAAKLATQRKLGRPVPPYRRASTTCEDRLALVAEGGAALGVVGAAEAGISERLKPAGAMSERAAAASMARLAARIVIGAPAAIA